MEQCVAGVAGIWSAMPQTAEPVETSVQAELYVREAPVCAPLIQRSVMELAGRQVTTKVVRSVVGHVEIPVGSRV